MDDTGKLVTQAGQSVLDESGGEITLDPQKGPVAIAADGTISQGVERVGKVAVVKFDSLSALDKAGDNLYRNTSNQQPQALPTAVIHQSMLENSNVNSITEMTRLINVNRAYADIAKLVEEEHQRKRQAADTFTRQVAA